MAAPTYRSSSTMASSYVTKPGQLPRYNSDDYSTSSSASTSSNSYYRSSNHRNPISPTSQEPSLTSDTGTYSWDHMPEVPDAPPESPRNNYDYRKSHGPSAYPPYQPPPSHYPPQYPHGYFPGPDPMGMPPMHTHYGGASPPAPPAGYPGSQWDPRMPYSPLPMPYPHQLPVGPIPTTPQYPYPPSRQPFHQAPIMHETDQQAYPPPPPVADPISPGYHEQLPPSRRNRRDPTPEIAQAPAPAEPAKRHRGGILKTPKHEAAPPSAPAPPKTPGPPPSQMTPAPGPPDLGSPEPAQQRRERGRRSIPPPPGAYPAKRDSSRPAPRRSEGSSYFGFVDEVPEPKSAAAPPAASAPAPPPPVSPAPPPQIPPPANHHSGYDSDGIEYGPGEELMLRSRRLRSRSRSRGRGPAELPRTRRAHDPYRSPSRSKSRPRRGRYATTDGSEYVTRHRSRSRFYDDRYEDDDDREPLRITQDDRRPPRRSRSTYRYADPKEAMDNLEDEERQLARRSKPRRGQSRPGDRKYDREREERRRKRKEEEKKLKDEQEKREAELQAQIDAISAKVGQLMENPHTVGVMLQENIKFEKLAP